MRLNIGTVRNLEMASKAYLSADAAVFPDFRTAGNTYLRSHGRMLADFYIVGDLDEVVQFYAPANNGRSDTGSVDGRTGTDLYIFFENDIAELRDLLVGTVRLWCKPKAITADHRIGVNNTAVADDTIMENSCAGVNAYAFAQADIPTNKNLVVNQAVVTDTGTFLHDRERTDTDVFPIFYIIGNRSLGRNGWLNLLVDKCAKALHQLGHSSVHIIDPDERCRNRRFGLERPGYKQSRGISLVSVRLIFRVAQKGYGTGASFLYFTGAMYPHLRVALNGAAQKGSNFLHTYFHATKV